MKAKIINNTDDSQIILSIGMIVKNEEKVLRRCLESLQPLMAEIPSELIIADTGSTDSTFDIAKEFTDNVFHFEWIDDFSAARNSTLDKARGIWYMFVDADEYLDKDIHEIVEFFKIPELYNHYKTAQIVVRNYSNIHLTEYADLNLPRFQRIKNIDDANIARFWGRVHETIYMRQPMGYFQTILHHTGYVYENDLQHKKKNDRNLVLMREEYKDTPDKLRTISQLIDGTTYYPEEAEKYIADGLEFIKNDQKNLYRNVFFMQSVVHYQNRNPEYALELCEKYYDGRDDLDNCITTIAIEMMKGEIYAAQGRYEQAYESFEKYFKLHEENENEKLNISDASAHPIYGITRLDYMKCVYSSVLCLRKLRRFDDAFSLIDRFNFEKVSGDEFTTLLAAIRDIVKESKNYTKLAEYYGKTDATGENGKRTLGLYMIESVFYSLNFTEERMNFAKQVISTGVSGKFIELMNLFYNQKQEMFVEKLEGFIRSIPNLDDGYSESIYLAIKYRLDISDIVIKMNSSLFREKLQSIANTHGDFAECVLAYGMPESYMLNIKSFYWLTSLYEKAAYRSFNLNERGKYEMYLRFTSLLGDYVMNVYNPELMNDEDIDVLPDLHKFGYFMSKANSALSEGDSVEYIRGLKNALTHCESMKEIVQFLLQRFQQLIK